MDILGKRLYFAGLLCILFNVIVVAEDTCLNETRICNEDEECCPGLACRAHPSTFYEVSFCFPPDKDWYEEYNDETTAETTMMCDLQGDGPDPCCEGLECQPADGRDLTELLAHQCATASIPLDVGWRENEYDGITMALVMVVSLLAVFAMATSTCSIIYIIRSKRRAEKSKTLGDEAFI